MGIINSHNMEKKQEKNIYNVKQKDIEKFQEYLKKQEKKVKDANNNN
jgi:hypothetical protein